MTPLPVSDAPGVVIDTNWALDLLVFDDPRAQPLSAALDEGRWRWLACDAMRVELVRVLGYPAVARRLAAISRAPAEVLDRWDRWVSLVDAPPPSRWRCRDADDQVFIDLAVQHQLLLLSKDREVLKLRRSLVSVGVIVESIWIV